MRKYRTALSICLSLIFITSATSIKSGWALGKDNDSNNIAIEAPQPQIATAKPSDYPNKIRDDLAPVQYFRMAEMLLEDYDLNNAKQCLKKLRDNSTSLEAQSFAALLEKSAMPQVDVPEEALNLLKEAMKIEKQNKSEKAREIYRSLIARYPHFDWPYLQLAINYSTYSSDAKAVDELLGKALAVSPNNINILTSCVNHERNRGEHERAYEHCLRIRDIDPMFTTYDISWELENHNRAANAKNTIHRASPIITAPVPNLQLLATSAGIPWHDIGKMPERFQATLQSTMVTAMRQTAERDESYPPQIINQKGEIQFDLGPNVDTKEGFNNNLLAVRSDDRTQYWNTNGRQAFSKSFDDGNEFSEGLAAAKRDHWGFIDGTGTFVIANKFQYVHSFSEGLAAVSVEGNWGFVNKKGEIVIEPIYEQVKSFSNGLAVVKLRGKIGYIDASGHLAIPPTFDSGRSFSDGMAEVGFLDKEKHELRLCYIDTSGKVCIDTSKIEAAGEVADKETSIHILDDGSTVFGFMDAMGIGHSDKIPRDFHCGLAGIKLGKNFGYIDKNGKVVIQPEYSDAFDFSENLATVQPINEYRKIVIDSSGNTVVASKYNNISEFYNGIAVMNRFQQSSNAVLWGYIDKRGEEIIPPQYFEAAPFSNGFARVRPSSLSIAAAKAAKAADAAAPPAVQVEKSNPIARPVLSQAAQSPQILPSLTSAPVATRNWAQAMTAKITSAWPADTLCTADGYADYTFKLDQSGSVYDITFTGGCASPETMLATVHSLLFAMPFDKQIRANSYTLRLKSESNGKPNITISAAETDSQPTDVAILESMPGDKKTEEKGILRQWQYEKLLFLCERAAKYPDSVTVNAELNKIFNVFELNAANSHDWLCVARGNPPQLKLRQNPDDKDDRNCNAPVGAIFQAWKLASIDRKQKQEQNEILYELEEAYRHKLALDLLRSNGVNRLSFGIAADLMDHYSQAVKIYSQCQTESPFAKKLITRFSANIANRPVSKSAATALSPQDWKVAIKWLPTDSEVLIALLHLKQIQDFDKPQMVGSLHESLQDMLAGHKVKKSNFCFALSGGRSFQAPREIGGGDQSGANITATAQGGTDLNSKIAGKKLVATIETINGFDILIAEIDHDYSQPSVVFIARPFSNVEISASNRHYLRQILSRIKSKAADSAFPDDLPEWSTIDLKADCWAIRHYDKSCAPFDHSTPRTMVPSDDNSDNYGIVPDTSCSAFTFSGNLDGSFKVSFLGTNPKTLKGLTDGWNQYSEVNTGQFWGTGKGPQDYPMTPLKVTFNAAKTVATASGKTTKVTAPMLNLILLNQLGFMIAL